MHVHSRHAFLSFRYARLHLQRLDHIAFTKQHGGVYYFLSGQFFGAYLRSLDHRGFEARYNNDFLKHFRNDNIAAG